MICQAFIPLKYDCICNFHFLHQFQVRFVLLPESFNRNVARVALHNEKSMNRITAAFNFCLFLHYNVDDHHMTKQI